ncbi:non-ribosomal peptide synthetase [Pendulispora brunnea]|uniref:Non-ribosomal peptide synthetase n=1 Tax=Pendulispora brunnea TaxID=2905690 RepID=A0ABZ2KR51_9BACT
MDASAVSISHSPAFFPTSRSEHKEQPPQPANLAELLLRVTRRYPRTGICLISTERDGKAELLSYPALLDEARRILGGLQAYDRGPGAKIALLLERASDFIPAFWACVLGGYVPCPLVPIRNDAERWAKHLAHIDTLLEKPLFISTGALVGDLPGVQAADLDELRTGTPRDHVHAAKPHDPALLVLTSGSTGNSKAVVLTHGNLIASMAGKKERHELTAADVTLNWISFDHVAALLEMHLLPLYAGAVQLHVDPAVILADPLMFLRFMDRYRVSVTFTPNFLFGQINAALSSAKHADDKGQTHVLDLSCVRHIISGGEAIVVETGRRFLDLLEPFGLSRKALWPAFGMTETCAGSVFSREFPERDENREFACLGLPIAGLQMRVMNDDGLSVPDGESGELQLRGPMVFGRYHNNEEATHGAFTPDGWFRTGDLGRIENGRLHLVGRSKDSIIVSGVNYFSHELETALEQLDGIERSFVAAFPTRPKGADTEQLVVAFAPTFALDDEAKLHQLTIAVRNTVIMLWGFRPTLILPLPKGAFPKTSLGKIQRSLLRKRLEAGELASHEAHIADVTRRQLGGYTPPAGLTETAIAAIFAELFGLDPSTVSATASFFDLGGTSLDIIKLKQLLQERLGFVNVPVISILQNPTVRGLASQDEKEYDPIVPLQMTGTKTPLFCIHPGVGEVLVYVNLANYFVNERPFYALRARGFKKGEAYFTSMEELVSTYVDAIRKKQPHGPYAIAGYSFSGPVAFEIAKVLESQGERVAFVGSIDMRPHIVQPGSDFFDEVETTVLLAFFLSLINRKQMDELPAQLRAGLPHQDPCAAILQLAPPERVAELDLDLPKLQAWSALAHSLVLVAKKYVPTGNVESMTVFYAEPLWGTKQEWLSDQLKNWDAFTRAPNRYIEVGGEHHTLMDPKHVATFQAVLRAELDRALDGQ